MRILSIYIDSMYVCVSPFLYFSCFFFLAPDAWNWNRKAFSIITKITLSRLYCMWIMAKSMIKENFNSFKPFWKWDISFFSFVFFPFFLWPYGNGVCMKSVNIEFNVAKKHLLSICRYDIYFPTFEASIHIKCIWNHKNNAWTWALCFCFCFCFLLYFFFFSFSFVT